MTALTTVLFPGFFMWLMYTEKEPKSTHNILYLGLYGKAALIKGTVSGYPGLPYKASLNSLLAFSTN
jgi:hypothetical protein